MHRFLAFVLIALFSTGCAAAAQRPEHRPEQPASLFDLILQGKEQSALRLIDCGGDYDTLVEALESDWYEDSNVPPPAQLVTFYKFLWEHYPFNPDSWFDHFGRYYYKWQLNKKISEDPQRTKYSRLWAYAELAETVERANATFEYGEDWAREAEGKLVEMLASEDFLKNTGDIGLYAYMSNGEYEKINFEFEEMPAFVTRFSDQVFAVCAIASTEFYEEDVRLREYCDKLFDKLTSRQAKFFLAMYRCSGDIPADQEDLEKWLERAAELAPTPRAAGIILYRLFEPYSSDTEEQYQQGEVYKNAEKLVTTCQSGPCAAKAFSFMVGTYLNTGDLKGAEQLIDDYNRQYPKSDVISMGLFGLSRFYFGIKRFERSLQILQRVVRQYPNSTAAAYAQLGMGEVYEELGDREKAVEAYTKAATFKLSPATQEVTGNVMDASNTRDMATEMLAALLEKMGRYEEALKWYRAWKPSGWCGNYLAMQDNKRCTAIVRLLLAMKRSKEATTYLKDMVHEGFDTPNYSKEMYPAVQYVNLRIEAGADLADLKREFERLLEKWKHNDAAKVAYEYVELLQKVEDEDLSVVFDVMKTLDDNSYGMSWHTLGIRDILMKKPKEAVDELLKRLPERDWHIVYCLGELGDRRATEPLLKMLENEKDKFLRENIAEVLVKLHADSLLKLVQYLDSSTDELRRKAARALGKLSDKRAFEPLLAELEKERIHVYTIAGALAGIGDPRAVVPLMIILLKRSRDSFGVLDAVRELTNQRFGLDEDTSEELQQQAFDRWEKWWNENRHKYDK
jgi:tetratricopeptide (TPR) repeat protein